MVIYENGQLSRRLSIAEEATTMIRVAHREHEFDSIKWDSKSAVY